MRIRTYACVLHVFHAPDIYLKVNASSGLFNTSHRVLSFKRMCWAMLLGSFCGNYSWIKLKAMPLN